MQGFARWREMLPREGHVVTAATVLDESGYTEMWKQDKSPEAPGRLDNLKEFLRAHGRVREPGRLPRTRRAGDGERRERPSSDRVSLMTLHAAKGLEFDTVFLPGWEEGHLPVTSAAWTKAARRRWRRSGASPMSA